MLTSMQHRTDSDDNIGDRPTAMKVSSQRKSDKIKKRKEEWRAVLSEGKYQEKVTLTRDRRLRVEWNEEESDRRRQRNLHQLRQERREERSEAVRFANRTLKDVEDDAVDTLREKRLREELEREKEKALKEEQRRRRLEMEMAAPPPKPPPPVTRKRQLRPSSEKVKEQRAPPEKKIKEPSLLDDLFSSILDATACCAGEEPVVMDAD